MICPSSTPNPAELLPLTPAVFHVLLALADSELHGYAIMQEVTTTTRGALKLGPGRLYGTIKRLLAIGLIEESDQRPDPQLDDERRRYYRLTGLGQRTLAAEVARYEEVLTATRRKRLFANPAPLNAGGNC